MIVQSSSKPPPSAPGAHQVNYNLYLFEMTFCDLVDHSPAEFNIL